MQLSKQDFSGANAPLIKALNDLEASNRYLDVSLRGLSVLTGLPELAQALAGIGKENDSDSIKKVLELATFVDTYKRDGFQMAFQPAVINLWARLESAIRETVSSIITNKKDFLLEKPFADIKLTLYESRTMDGVDLIDYVYRELERSTRSQYQPGVAKFEAILGAVSLAGRVKRKTKRDLIELHQVRNVLLHRYGVADSHFKKACPWRREKVGRRIKVTGKHYYKYLTAVCDYLATVSARIRKACGVKRAYAKVKI